MTNNINIGDKIQFSTELLKQIDEMPDRHTETVFVSDIREEDEFKVIVLQRCERMDAAESNLSVTADVMPSRPEQKNAE